MRSPCIDSIKKGETQLRTLHQRLLRLQVNFLKEKGFRVIRREVAERFAQRFTARIVARRHHNGKPFSMLILDYDHPEVGRGTQLLAYLAPYPPK